MSEFNEFYYDQQIKDYLKQFMAIFAGMQVKIGKNNTKDERLITTPIVYASKDRTVASIYAGNTQNKPLRLPMFSAYISNITMASELRKGIAVERSKVYTPIGGLVPDDMKVIHQVMPVPYKLQVELNIYASNTDQHFQLLEQILTLFDPILQIEKNDEIFDWTRMTTIELMDISTDTNVPSGVEPRVITSTLQFEFPIYLSLPTQLKNNIVKQVQIRIAAINEIEVDADEEVFKPIFDDLDEDDLLSILIDKTDVTI